MQLAVIFLLLADMAGLVMEATRLYCNHEYG